MRTIQKLRRRQPMAQSRLFGTDVHSPAAAPGHLPGQDRPVMKMKNETTEHGNPMTPVDTGCHRWSPQTPHARRLAASKPSEDGSTPCRVEASCRAEAKTGPRSYAFQAPPICVHRCLSVVNRPVANVKLLLTKSPPDGKFRLLTFLLYIETVLVTAPSRTATPGSQN